jgi:abhydrolase domain-containing protein 14
MSLRLLLALALLAACSRPADVEPAPEARPVAGPAEQPAAAPDEVPEPELVVLTIPLREWQIHALQMGDESAPCVLFLHGARYSAKDWHANGTLAFVARRGWRALAVDVPGFGGTGGLEIRNHYELLPELIAAARLDRPVVVAPSMGGLYLLTILHQHHGLLRGIVPIAPVGVRSLVKPIPVELPALIVWGANDTTIPPAQADELASRLPGSQKEILSDAGHACYLDQTQRFHALLGAFLDGLRSH